MGVTLGWLASRDGGDMPRTSPVDGSECSRGCSFTKSPPSAGLPVGESLLGNWSRAKYHLEGWGFPQNWGRVETPEAVELALCEIEDYLEALSVCVAAGILGSLCFLVVKSVIEERERGESRRERGLSRRESLAGARCTSALLGGARQ